MGKGMEALKALRQMDDAVITVDQASAVLGCHPQSIRKQAELDQKALGFNVIRIGNRVIIPRIPFLQYVEGTAVTQ